MLQVIAFLTITAATAAGYFGGGASAILFAGIALAAFSALEHRGVYLEALGGRHYLASVLTAATSLRNGLLASGAAYALGLATALTFPL